MKLQYKVTLGCRSRWPCGQGVGLQPLNAWNRGFESRSKYESSSPIFVVCRVGSGLCDGLITRSEESYCVCVCVSLSVCLIVCDLDISTVKRLRPDLGCCAT
jgi:hypothetical protein